jgi:hypothetical protein
VFGEDCRRAVRIGLVFSDIFDVKRHKNLDKYSKLQQTQVNDLEKAPSAVFNPFATQQIFYDPNANKDILRVNFIEDWPEQTEDQIEASFRSS